MSELFGEYKRPKAEVKYIEKFVRKFNRAKNEYKSKNFQQAIEQLNQAYQLLLEIWDTYPKVITLYLIMKSNFYCKEYDNCEEIKEQLENMLLSIYKDKRNVYFKIKSKLLLYDLILLYIKDDLNGSIDSVLSTITYITENEEINIEEKSLLFWKYIKGILKLTGITKSKKFEIFEEEYNAMIFVDTNSDLKKEDEEIKYVKKIKKSMLDDYKSFMNLKLRGIIYDYLDKEFYYKKYGNNKNKTKIMYFLQKNIATYVRDNNKQKLIENFETFLTLNRINLQKEFGKNMNELIHEQKRRIEAFDVIFSNLVGAFSNIFKVYFGKNDGDISSRKYKPVLTKQHCNMEEILTQMNSQSMLEKEKIKEIKMIEENKNNEISLNFKKEIKIPPNTEEMDKIIINNNIRNRLLHSKMNSSFSPHLYNSKNNAKTQQNKTNKNNESLGSEESTKNLGNNNNSEKDSNVERKKSFKSTTKIKVENFRYRNINNFLIAKLISIFTPVFKIQNGVYIDNNTDLKYVPIIPSRKDLFNLNYQNIIKSYGGSSIKGTNSPENQDTFFYYENFMLIKNCILFGVCDGHGKNGSEISNLISVLYPSYIFYLIIDNNLIRKRQELNDLMLKLFQLEESPEKTKDKHILRYILNKLGVDCSCIPFVSGDKKELFNLLFESIHLSRNDLIKRFKIDIEYSGTTLCSGILSGNKLYISNIGDSRVVLGIFNNKGNIWKSKQLSIDHEPSSPNENRRIIQCNGRIDRFKNAFGEEFGKLRVFEKDIESIKPALAMTRSIGDDEAKKIGVIYEPELFVYDIGNEHRILVVGSDGLWSYMTNEEVIEIAGRCYDNGGKAEEASSILIETAKNRWLQNTKKNEKTKREKNNSDDIYGGKKSEGELEHKKHKKSYDDITCLVIFLNVK